MDETLRDLQKEISGVKSSISDLELNVKTTIAALETNVKAVFKRIDEQRISHDLLRDLSNTTGQLTLRIDTLEKTIDRVEKSVDEMKMKPGRRWDQVTMIILQLGIGIVLGFIAMKLGLQ